MSSLKLSLLSCAVALFSLPALAADYDNPFIKDAKVDGRIQTVFFNEKDTFQDVTRGAWTGAVWLNAQSGYIADLIAVGGSAYRVALLDMKSGNISPLNDSSSDFLLNANNEGFGKLGQVYLDMQLPTNSDDISASARVGRQIIQTGLVRTSVARSVPGSWQGVNTSFGMGKFNGEVAWLNRVNERSSAAFDHILSDNGEVIDWVLATQFGLTFDLGDAKSLELQYKGGLAKDYIIGHNGIITFDMLVYKGAALSLSGQYYRAEQHGHLWDPTIALFENKAQTGNINATLSSGSWTFNVGASYTKAPVSPTSTQFTIGSYDSSFGSNTLGVFGVSTSALYSFFSFDDETAFVIGAQYDFAGSELKGLSLSNSFFLGTGMKVNNGVQQVSVHEMENDLAMTYQFQQPELKGLELQLAFTYYTNSNELAIAAQQGGQKIFRSYLIYHFSV